MLDEQTFYSWLAAEMNRSNFIACAADVGALNQGHRRIEVKYRNSFSRYL
ncbi:hypothetical protein [Edwardsiella ictaluri]|uniref:Uncharacterized protein n=1 Tax=Edwardsiella ictaluri TaxID=67780 RepID=A0ABY8GK66_EDWIC|nr:hypothetical protein [Edwardsiella ictaluri]WFN97712.1 hypothetical protein MAY91_06930 [Edwardsiella ictaluri]